MKKFLTACILIVLSTTSFATSTISKEVQTQKLTQQIAYARDAGATLRKIYNANPSYYAKMANWNVDTPTKNQCILENLNNTGYANMIYPSVTNFAKTQTVQQMQSYIDLMQNGLADGQHNLMLLTLQTQQDFFTGKITAEQRTQFIQTSPLITVKQRKAFIASENNPTYKNFITFLNYGSLEPISTKNPYQLGSKFGAEQSQQFNQYIANTCHLN